MEKHQVLERGNLAKEKGYQKTFWFLDYNGMVDLLTKLQEIRWTFNCNVHPSQKRERKMNI